MNKKILYLDCYNGISGDMFLGALIDSGLSLEQLKETLSLLPVDGYRLSAEKVLSYGISGTDIRITDTSAQYYRSLKDITNLINESSLSELVKKRSIAVFKKIAYVESRIHGVSISEIHFHEIGALDSIIDIVGVIAGISCLGIDEIVSSPLPFAGGMIKIEHGMVPLPAPATAAIMADSKIPVYGVDRKGELVTPTGAALIAELADRFGEIPQMKIENVGYGAGKKDFGIPNFLRVFIGKKDSHLPAYNEEVNIIEANIDDMSGEISGYVMEKLLKEGALDVYITPVQMKKNRPAIKITVLSTTDKVNNLVKLLLKETTTLGCRLQTAAKIMLPRSSVEVNTPWGTVTVKVAGKLDGGGSEGTFFKFAPEYEDCVSISQRENIALAEVYRVVNNIFEQEHSRYFLRKNP